MNDFKAILKKQKTKNKNNNKQIPALAQTRPLLRACIAIDICHVELD